MSVSVLGGNGMKEGIRTLCIYLWNMEMEMETETDHVRWEKGRRF